MSNYEDMISAKVIEDSKSLYTHTRATTLVITAPKFLDAEFEKHRAISSNSSSDRAIPFFKMRERDPYLPFDVRKHQSGMQGYENVDDYTKEELHGALSDLYNHTINVISYFDENVHKQHLNRYLMGFSIQTKVITATDWDNFFLVRLPFNELSDYLKELAIEWKKKHGGHPDGAQADPSMIKLAQSIYYAMQSSLESEVELLRKEDWHLPFITIEERNSLDLDTLQKCSAARCARTSYNNHDKTNPIIEKDLELAEILLKNYHPTPFEHQLTPINYDLLDQFEFVEHGLETPRYNGISHIDKYENFYSGNIRDFIQYRKLLGM